MRIDGDDARDLFAQARVSRLATVGADSTPHLVPVTFAVIAESHPESADTAAAELIVFAVDHKPKSTTALRRLENIAANPQVCFLVDHFDEDWQQLWWVRADANARVLHGVVRDRALSALAAKYRQYQDVPPTGTAVGALVRRWSGWRAKPES